MLDVCECFVERVDHLDGHSQRKELGAERLVVGLHKKGRLNDSLKSFVSSLVGLDANTFRCQLLAKCRQVAQAVAMDDETVEGIANADAARLCIHDDGCSFLKVGCAVHVAMHHARSCFNHWHLGMLAYIIN